MAKTEKKLAVVVISVDDFTNGRKAANNIENMTFKKATDVSKEILKHTQLENDNKQFGIELYPMTEFMELCNNQELDLEHNWISYVYITDPNFR